MTTQKDGQGPRATSASQCGVSRATLHHVATARRVQIMVKVPQAAAEAIFKRAFEQSLAAFLESVFNTKALDQIPGLLAGRVDWSTVSTSQDILMQVTLTCSDEAMAAIVAHADSLGRLRLPPPFHAEVQLVWPGMPRLRARLIAPPPSWLPGLGMEGSTPLANARQDLLMHGLVCEQLIFYQASFGPVDPSVVDVVIALRDNCTTLPFRRLQWLHPATGELHSESRLDPLVPKHVEAVPACNRVQASAPTSPRTPQRSHAAATTTGTRTPCTPSCTQPAAGVEADSTGSDKEPPFQPTPQLAQVEAAATVGGMEPSCLPVHVLADQQSDSIVANPNKSWADMVEEEEDSVSGLPCGHPLTRQLWELWLPGYAALSRKRKRLKPRRRGGV